jgi:hypothetical protein
MACCSPPRSPHPATLSTTGATRWWSTPRGKVPLYLLIDIEAKPATVTLFSNPSEGQYQSQQTVTLGEKLPLPAPFGITLDTAGLQAS